MSKRSWRVGHEYRDRAGFPDDEFLSWLRTDKGSIGNAGGIRFKDRFGDTATDAETGRQIPAYMILTTRDLPGQYHNPWDDLVDDISGNIHYWGDAKFSKRERYYDSFAGNARLEAINNLRLAGRLKDMPPILHFSRKRPGYLRFNGLCALSDLRHAWFEDKGKPVKNLRALLSILDEEEVCTVWLNARVTEASVTKVDSAHAPTAWKKAIRGQIKRRHVWAAKIRSKSQQLPPEGSEDAAILAEVRALLPDAFEAFVVALVDRIPNIVPGLDHMVTRTRRAGDHGLDFFGRFRLPHPIGYEIDFLGEAKRHASAITPDQVSRLVARLGRGQYGLYFTTSWFSEQTQREIESDRYPVRLFSGSDIVDFLREGGCLSNARIRKDWLDAALSGAAMPLADGLKPLTIW
ncbi:restriction endonuclease [Sphingomicrobium clamense]|uniref:Restriction endonuclease n=1 Tax=Sphingomicrobium clamense TaxID=2851013 RepID=A0ABS6V862_9SPHN|nr:restriction endonuclease [Sphingomicrobium sp. B8]MBW0145772.1 restriction endonuclease [Sphingomicrobium sp. B8]